MIGQRIGQLVVTKKLGEGGMGAVYLAQHQVLQSLWVVKVLLPQWSQNPTLVQRFINEARAASQIKHDNIIDIGDCAQLPDGSWYIVMKYLEGGTLDAFLQSQGGPISMRLALQILAPAAHGLNAAHEHGIVHRDLKTENIYLVRKDGNDHFPIVIDFGIAKLNEATSGLRTEVGVVAGTLAYMAPEQIYDIRTVDRRSDVYALGVIAYQLVTGGWFPYQRREAPSDYFTLSPAGMYEIQKTQVPIDPRVWAPHVSERWVAVIFAAIHFDRERRPRNALAFISALAEGLPAEGDLLSGVDIVKKYAPAFNTMSMTETVRAPRPADAPKVLPASSAPASKYRIGDPLGEGGMAEVFHAVVTGVEGFTRPVAIKRVRGALSTNPDFAAMFVQEAQLVAQLHHPNIVTVLDFDRDSDGRLFLVLEFVDGPDLGRLIKAGRLPHSVAVFITTEILRGLGYAHQLPTPGAMRGLVHRDMSPSNVLLSWEGAVKVSDFGLAKARETTEASASVTLKGKPGFMSPEQAAGTALDGRSDLFSVGVMLWEILTGERLFWSGDFHNTLARVLNRPIPRPSMVSPVKPDLELVIMRLLARDLGERYATADEAIDALSACEDAPKNGRSELTRLLTERFPGAVRMSRAPLGAVHEARSATPATVADGPLAPPVHAVGKPSTLSQAMGQSTAPSEWAGGRVRWIVTALLLVGAAAGALVVVRGGHDDQRETADKPRTVTDAAGANTTPLARVIDASPADAPQLAAATDAAPDAEVAAMSGDAARPDAPRGHSSPAPARDPRPARVARPDAGTTALPATSPDDVGGD